MAAGAWESIVIDGRRFTCKADDDVSYSVDGFQNEVLVQGDGSNTIKKTRHTGKISGISVNIDDSRDDIEFLQEVQNKLDFVAVSGTKVDGTVLSGNMQLTEMLEVSSAENTCSLTLEGSLKKL